MRSVTFIILSLLLSACATPKIQGVESSYNTNVNLTKFETFSWTERTVDKNIPSRYYTALQNAVENELRSKGYRQSTESPDFKISAILNLSKEKVTIEYVPFTRRINDTITTSVLYGGISLNFFSASTGEKIFNGMVKSVVDKSFTPEEREKRITMAVEDMLQNFPTR